MPDTNASSPGIDPLTETERAECTVFLSGANEAYLEAKDSTVDYEVSLRRLLDEYNEKATFLMDWATKSTTHTRVYRILVFRQHGILKNDIYDICKASDRTIRRRLSELEEREIIDQHGYPKQVSIVNDDIYTMMVDLLRLI